MLLLLLCRVLCPSDTVAALVASAPSCSGVHSCCCLLSRRPPVPLQLLLLNSNLPWPLQLQEKPSLLLPALLLLANEQAGPGGELDH